MDHIYYYRGSSGRDTNLQLYALRHARDLWQSLTEDYDRDGEETEALKERCVLTLATLGLSISQLLGQNNPKAESEVPYLPKIVSRLVKDRGLDPTISQRFEQFNDLYNGCRHFGVTVGARGYERVDQLTYSKTKECFDFGLEIWEVIVRSFAQDHESEIDEFVIEELGRGLSGEGGEPARPDNVG